MIDGLSDPFSYPPLLTSARLQCVLNALKYVQYLPICLFIHFFIISLSLVYHLQHIFVVPCASFSTTETLISYSVPSAPHVNEETRLNPFSKKMGGKSCVTVPLTW